MEIATIFELTMMMIMRRRRKRRSRGRRKRRYKVFKGRGTTRFDLRLIT